MIASAPSASPASLRSLPRLQNLPCHQAVAQHHHNLLLMHQDEAELDALSQYLGNTYRLFIAKDENGLMRAIETHPIHLIVINMELNGLDGSQVCTRLKASPRYCQIPVVMLIARNRSASRIKSLESGADAYMEWPFTAEYLHAQIKNLLGNRARIKAYFAQSFAADVNAPAMQSKEVEHSALLQQLHTFIADHLSNPDLDIDLLARQMNMSRPTLYRKIKCISDHSPNELINIARLNRAAELLSTSHYKIFQVARMVGFHSLSNFGKAFLKQYKVTPTEYQQKRAH